MIWCEPARPSKPRPCSHIATVLFYYRWLSPLHLVVNWPVLQFISYILLCRYECITREKKKKEEGMMMLIMWAHRKPIGNTMRHKFHAIMSTVSVKQRMLLADIVIVATASVRLAKDHFELRAVDVARALFKHDAIECRYICCRQMRRRICLQRATRRGRSRWRRSNIWVRWRGEKISKLNGIFRRRRKPAQYRVSTGRLAPTVWWEWWTRDTTTWCDNIRLSSQTRIRK